MRFIGRTISRTVEALLITDRCWGATEMDTGELVIGMYERRIILVIVGPYTLSFKLFSPELQLLPNFQLAEQSSVCDMYWPISGLCQSSKEAEMYCADLVYLPFLIFK